MKTPIFVTGNPNKAAQFSAWIGRDIPHQSIDTDEIQSTDLREVVQHKAKQAFAAVGSPVIVEDVALVFTAIAPLPGPFIKWFNAIGFDKVCRIPDGFDDRSAVVTVLYGVYDGKDFHFFEGSISGSIVDKPRGSGGFGFDAIFQPDGYTQSRAEMNETDYNATSPRKLAIDRLREYLDSIL